MKESLFQRIEDLKNVASWSLENGGLTSGQRICLHQERAACLRQIEELEFTAAGDEYYKIPPHLEEKVSHILGVIKNTKWVKCYPVY